MNQIFHYEFADCSHNSLHKKFTRNRLMVECKQCLRKIKKIEAFEKQFPNLSEYFYKSKEKPITFVGGKYRL